jgi:hypothetical protein
MRIVFPIRLGVMVRPARFLNRQIETCRSIAFSSCRLLAEKRRADSILGRLQG